MHSVDGGGVRGKCADERRYTLTREVDFEQHWCIGIAVDFCCNSRGRTTKRVHILILRWILAHAAVTVRS